MNKYFHISFLCALLCFAHSVSSQSSFKAFNADNTKYQSIESSEELQISKIDGMAGMDNFVIYKEIKNLPSTTKDNHKFTLHLEGEWYELAIGNGDDFHDNVFPYMLGGDPYQTSLPEGYYDIIIFGVTADYNSAYVCYDQILIDKDTEMTAKMEDAIHKIEIAPVDDQNNPINDMELSRLNPCYLFNTFINTYILAWMGSCMYVNDMGDRNKLFIATSGYDRANNTTYFIAMPLIENGVTEDILFENKSEEVVHYNQMFHISKELTEDSYSHYALLMVFYDLLPGRHGWYQLSLLDTAWVFDRDKPYSLYTNLRFNDTPQAGDINVFLTPLFYESFKDLDILDMEGIIAPFPMAINKNGELMIDFLSFCHSSVFLHPNDIVATICNNSIAKPYNKEEFYNEGYRTPHLYHQAVNYTAESSPSGTETRINTLLFLGEFGEQKYNHTDVIVTVKGDGNVIFNGDILSLNWNYNLNKNCSQYQIEVTNKEVFAYGKNMINHTVIDFDMTKPDVNPPTLTMLRVIDDEKISMTVSHPENARLEITAGDFTPDFTKGYLDLVYDKKPNLEVSWSVDGEIFYDLPVEEDATKKS